MIVNFVRTQKLYIGYAVLWLLSVIGLMITVSFPPLLAFVTSAIGAIFPASALTLLAFVFVFFILIIYSLKLSILTSKQSELIQQIALNELIKQEKNGRDNEIKYNP